MITTSKKGLRCPRVNFICVALRKKKLLKHQIPLVVPVKNSFTRISQCMCVLSQLILHQIAIISWAEVIAILPQFESQRASRNPEEGSLLARRALGSVIGRCSGSSINKQIKEY